MLFRLVCIVCLMFVQQALTAQGRWYRLGAPSPQELTKVVFVDSLRGFAAGDSGMMIKTTNGGMSWSRVQLGIQYPINELMFLNRNIGWASAWRETLPYGTMLLKTTDGGESWQQYNYPEDYTFIEAIHFFDANNGVLGGLFGYFARTTDGGTNWVKSYVDTTSFVHFPVLNFTFKDRKFGFAYGGHIDIAGVIWRTLDSGKSWYGFPASPEPIRGMHFVDNNNIVAVGGDFEYGTSIIRSFNGGLDWEYNNLEVMGVGMTLRPRTATEFWVPLGFARKFLVTYDAGRTWSTVDTPDSSIIFDIQFIDSTLGYGVGPLGEVIKYSFRPVVSVREGGTEKKRSLSVYPHPITDKAMILPSGTEPGKRMLQCFTVTGELVFEQELQYEGQERPVLFRRPKNCTAGVYIIKLTGGTEPEVKTVVFR